MKEKSSALKKFEIVPDSKNIRLKIFGSSPKEIFKNALFAMAHIQKPESVSSSAVDKIISRISRRNISESVQLESVDYDTMLVDFLENILELSDQRGVVFTDIKFRDFTGQKLLGKVSGARFDVFDKEIKSLIYDQMHIKELSPGQWEALLVFET